jgi:hypothetical protein
MAHAEHILSNLQQDAMLSLARDASVRTTPGRTSAKE